MAANPVVYSFPLIAVISAFPAAFGQLGIKVTWLGPSHLAASDLSRSEVILLGLRTCVARKFLKISNGRLLEYSRHGRVVVV